jgi:hypothetical protein
MLCYVMLCYVMLRYVLIYYVMLWYIVSLVEYFATFTKIVVPYVQGHAVQANSRAAITVAYDPHNDMASYRRRL